MTSPKTPTLYGIPNCDTVKKARAWLGDHGTAFVFHDFKKQGVPGEHLKAWLASAGWQKVVNRQGTAWRKLEPATQANVVDNASAVPVLLNNASVIKRPVVEWPDGAITVGFDTDDWSRRV